MGAAGCALKTQPADEIVAAIRAVARGERYVPADALEEETRLEPASPVASLSQREREVFELAIRGYRNDQMARALSISVKTIETHRAHINSKLSVHSSADLIGLAAGEGLLLGVPVGSKHAAVAVHEPPGAAADQPLASAKSSTDDVTRRPD
jgi:DNA-binding NarL/FixJ family response regulator